MFNMHDFVMKTLRAMRYSEPEYKVRELALVWYERKVLTDDDLTEIDSWYPEIDPEEESDEKGSVVEP